MDVPNGKPYHFEKISVSTVKSLTPGTPPDGNKPKNAIMSVIGDAINMRFDGTDPDATTGIRAAVNTTVNIDGEATIRALKMIKVSGTSTVSVQYFY